MKLRGALLAISLGLGLLSPHLVLGQGAPVYQDGTVVPGNIATFSTQGRIKDGGPLPAPGGGAAIAPTRVFVAPSGSDANSCLSTTPCQTLERALTVGTALLNTNGGSLYIKLAAGAYTQSLFVNGPLTGSINSAPNPNGTYLQPGQVVVEGAGSATTTWTGAGYCAVLASSNYANVAVRAVKLVGNANACQSSLFAQMAGTIHILDDVDFGPATIEHIHVENSGSSVQSWSSYKISGGAQRHITAGQNALFINSAFPTGVTTFVGTPVFTSQFVWATQASTVQWNANATMVGSFTGQRYAVTSGSNIKVPSGSTGWLPGTVAGYATTGGVYEGTVSPIVSGAVKTNADGSYQQAVCSDIFDIRCDGTAVWTPSLAFNGVVTGITYSSQQGFYYKIGKLIVAFADITLSSKGAAVGSAGIVGLPFAGNASLAQPCEVGYYAGLASITNFTGTYVNGSDTSIQLVSGTANGTTPYTNTNFTNTSRITVRCTYATN
jgi:hypothetical protein